MWNQVCTSVFHLKQSWFLQNGLSWRTLVCQCLSNNTGDWGWTWIMWISAQLYMTEMTRFQSIHINVFFIISFLHSENHTYLNVGAVFGKCLLSCALRPLSTVVACPHARYCDVESMRFLFHGLVAWWKCGKDRTNWCQISSYQILHTPVSLISKYQGAVWTQLRILQDRMQQSEKTSRTSLILHSETLYNSGWIMKSDLLYSDLAEVRFAVAALVQQHLSLPLQESQRLVPGGYRSHPWALMTLPQ